MLDMNIKHYYVYQLYFSTIQQMLNLGHLENKILCALNQTCKFVATQWQKLLLVDQSTVVAFLVIHYLYVYGQTLPRSVCNEGCHPGYSKQKKEEKQFCCYDCVPCPEGMISEQKGREQHG